MSEHRAVRIRMAGGPHGEVQGYEGIQSARSVIDLVAQLLKAEYGRG